MPETERDDIKREIVIPLMVPTAVTSAEAAALAELAYGKTVLELGAYHGFSTIVLASVAEHVTSVDWHRGDDHAGNGDTLAAYRNNLALYGVTDRVETVVGRFEDVLPGMAAAGRKFGGCFLDGHHSAESVTQDVALALPLIMPGGFLAFHDYGRGPLTTGHQGFGVTEVADRIGIVGVAGFLGWGFTHKHDEARDCPQCYFTEAGQFH